MAFAGGTFSRLYNWITDRDGAVKIRADRMDAEMDGFATGLSTCVLKDGTQTVTADLPMAGYKLTGVGDGDARNTYLAIGQLQDGEGNWVDGGGTADAITATYVPAITALVDGMLCFVRATTANATATPTFIPNGVGSPLTITKTGDVALIAGDIVGDGHELALRYRASDTKWELLNPAGQALDAGLNDIAGLAVTDGNIIVGDGTNWVAESGATALTSLGAAGIAQTNAWSGNQYFTPVTDDTSTSGVITFDFTSHGNYVEFTLTENLTDVNLTGEVAGGTYKIRLKQANASAYTITGWDADIIWTDSDTDPVMNTTNDKYTMITIEAGTTEHCGSSEDFG